MKPAHLPPVTVQTPEPRNPGPCPRCGERRSLIGVPPRWTCVRGHA